ncbi:hypothetical protein Hanom_Chr03g00260651 [Helianthus anomalus]
MHAWVLTDAHAVTMPIKSLISFLFLKLFLTKPMLQTQDTYAKTPVLKYKNKLERRYSLPGDPRQVLNAKW